MDNELFNSICNGDIKNSILLNTRIIFSENSNSILENVYIDICAYIGSFISLYDVYKLIDIYSMTKKIIENDKIIIKDIYALITKMCIVCDIYNKHPVTKCGLMSMKVLKEKVADIFNSEDMKLSTNGVMKFDGILPPSDNENYTVALKIIAIVIKTIKKSDDISVDHGDQLCNIANDLRYSLDYISRTKYKFETKFYNSDNDNIWFIWGVFSQLYNEECIAHAFWLYNYEFKKKYKAKRMGIVWSIGLLAIYIHKKDISKNWNGKEIIVINKMEEISIQLYNEIKQKIVKEYPGIIEVKPKEKQNDGMNFISNYIPIVGNVQNIVSSPNTNTTEIRAISF